jgi:hypothetical protein
MPQALQGRGVQRDPLQRGGARLHLQAQGQHGRLPGQGPLVHGHHGRVSPVSCVATEEEVTKASGRTSGRTSCKKSAACQKRGRGNLGREASPQEQRQSEGGEATSGRKGDPAAAAAARQGSPAIRDREVKPRVGGRKDKCGREDERDVVRKCRKGSFQVTSPPPPPRPLPLQPAPEDDLE